MSGSCLTLNGRRVEELLHSDSVDMWVAAHSSIPEVRDIVNERLRQVVKGKNALVEGRDIGTVVFPQAEVKIFWMRMWPHGRFGGIPRESAACRLSKWRSPLPLATQLTGTNPWESFKRPRMPSELIRLT